MSDGSPFYRSHYAIFMSDMQVILSLIWDKKVFLSEVNQKA